jgi:hypothetical protein
MVLSDAQILFCVVPDDKSLSIVNFSLTAIYKCW